MAEWKEAGMSGDSWKPETEGDKIQGIYKTLKTNVGINSSNVYVLETPVGEIDVWGSTVLDTKFSEIPQGSEVLIEYLGEVKGKGPKPYKNFTVKYREVPMKEAGNVEPASEDDVAKLKELGLL